MPSGRTLQIGSIHQYRDNFAKPYEISYETEKGTHAFCYQTTYGMSERLLGALIGVHGDNKGLILPPEVAPLQVVIIPIIFKGKEQAVLEVSMTLHKKLLQENIRSTIDDREITPGNKYYDWELKGVPLRIEIGPKDVEKNELTLVRRDTSKKKAIPLTDAEKTIKTEFQELGQSLYANAEKLLKDNMHCALTIEEAKQKTGIVALPWCGNKDCALEIENVLEGNTLGEPIENAGCSEHCPVCGSPANTWMRYAKSY
jgi:prolyl-tRNA synthetase